MSFKIRSQLQVIENLREFNEYLWPTYDGAANNMINPNRGKAHQNLIRIAGNAYNGGNVAVRGASNPSPRVISNSICKGGSSPSSMMLTDMVWVWGQFLDHEIDLTPDQGTGGETLNIDTGSSNPVDPDYDPNEDYPGRTIDFTRSQFNTVNSIREHPNVISSFIDATNVYGPSSDRCHALRLLDGSGKMKTHTADNGEVILPYNVDGLDNAMSTSSAFFVAGDVRANENVALTSMHAVFVREHNRLCDEIIASHPDYAGKDELIFQHARRIVIGYMQTITYDEFLPALLGSFPEYEGYDEKVDASVATEFSTVGYRLGHTMLSENIQIGNNPGTTVALRDAFFNPSYIQTNGIDKVLLGCSKKRMQNIDGIIVEDVRNFLFGPPTATHLLDLATLNIQRGRDHGIPDYNSIRVAYGLQPFGSFNAISTSPSNITKLTTLYDTVNDIDPWIGAIIENRVPGKAVGELLNAMLTEQFVRLRDGDRYWFENSKGLTQAKKADIRTTKLSDILSRNTDYTFQSDVFHI